MNFHKRLRNLQAKHGLTLKAIAEHCGVSYQTVQQWSKDEGTYPKIENLEPLAGILKTTPWFLLFGVTADGESGNRGHFPILSDEANDLIQCVAQFDRGDDYTRQLFTAAKDLLLLALHRKQSEDAQAGLDLTPLLPSPTQNIEEGERNAQEILSRDTTSGGIHAGPKRGGR